MDIYIKNVEIIIVLECIMLVVDCIDELGNVFLNKCFPKIRKDKKNATHYEKLPELIA